MIYLAIRDVTMETEIDSKSGNGTKSLFFVGVES